MKCLSSLLVFVFMMSVFIVSYAGPEKIVEKARAIVDDAAPDDWEAFAKAADLCIRKEVNFKEAKAWFEKSIEIKKSSEALEVAGDYYAYNKLYDKAINYYIESMLKMKEDNFNADTSELESKIAKAKKARDA